MVAIRDADLDALARLLADVSTELLVEHLAARLGQTAGHRTMTFLLDSGHLRKTRLEHAEIGNVELGAITDRSA